MKELTEDQKLGIKRTVSVLYYGSTHPDFELAKEAVARNLKPEFVEIALPFIQALAREDIN